MWKPLGLALTNQETQFAWHRAALCLGCRRNAQLCSALTRTHTAFARLDLTLLTSLDSHELGLFLCVPLGSHEPFFVVRTPPCFDNHHAGSTHEHTALTRAGDEPVIFASKARNMVQQGELGRVAFAGAFICFAD